MASPISPENQDSSSSIDDLRKEVDRMSLEDEDCWNLHFKSPCKTTTEPLRNANLGDKYQPKHFRDIVGHEITVQAISSAVEKMKIAPLYLFHGPGGTGKTSTARIFASSLTCESSTSQFNKPCWSCRGCFRSSRIVVGCKGIKTLFQSTTLSQEIPGFKVFVVKECHSFPAETWGELLGLAGRGLYDNGAVFVLVTTDVNTVPATVSSRCQKFCFSKLKDGEITRKLEKIVTNEEMTVDSEALRVITVKAQGSLREAENLLDQMALLGSTITGSMVQQLAGLLPRDTLLDLLVTAISRDTVKTIRRARELISTSIEPQALISQLASLVTDILSNPVAADSASSSSAGSSKEKQLSRESQLTNAHLERLCHALKILVETEKHLRSSSSTDHDSTVYGALLDITSGDVCNNVPTSISFPRSRTSNSGDNPNADSEYLSNRRFSRSRSHTHRRSFSRTSEQSNTSKIEPRPVIIKGIYQTDVYRGKEAANANDMEDIWQNMLGKIQSGYIKELLCYKVKLASLTISNANIIVHLMFRRHEDKMTAQMSEDSISRALEKATRCPVTVNMSLEPTDSGIIRANTIANKQSSTPSKQKQKMLPLPRDSFHSKNSEAEIRLNSQRESYPPLSENSRPAKYKDWTNYQRQDMCLLEEKEATTGSSQNVSSIRGHVTPKNQGGMYRDSESHIITREQPSEDKDRIITANKPRHRWLSLSSIPQFDASVEPYSQDILFERANKERERNTSQAHKFLKGFFKTAEDPDSPEGTMHQQLNHSWRCNEIFCSRKTEGRTSKP